MKTILATSTVFSSIALAHPGHDHSAVSAIFLHALWIAPVAVAAVAAVYFLRKKSTK